MLPPADPVVLATNPKFSALYQDLCANKLNPDGSSAIQDAKVLKERETFAQDLRKAREEVTRRELVALELRDLSSDTSALPEDLRELAVVIAAVLDGQIAEEDRDLLHDDIEKFKTNIDRTATALSSDFRQDVTLLSTLLDPDNPPPSQALVSAVCNLKTSITASEAELHASRLRLANEAAKVHALNRQITQHSIATLEQTIHGSVARGSKAKAEYLAIVAQGMSKKLTWQQRQIDAELHAPEVQKVLSTKVEEIEAKSRACKRKVREAEDRLEGYRGVGGMEAVAREYAEVGMEMQRVRGEIERLK